MEKPPLSFSKEYYPLSRRHTAMLITGHRDRVRQENQWAESQFQGELQKLVEQAEKETNDLNRTVSSIKELEQRLEKSRRTATQELISKIKAKFDTQEKENRKHAARQKFLNETFLEKDKDNLAIQRKNLESIYQQIEELKNNFRLRRSLDGAKKILDEFHARMGNEWTAFKNEREARDLGNFMRRNNVLVTHGFLESMDKVAINNPETKRDLDMETRLKIILSLEPALATAVSKNNTFYWGKIGLVLGGGEIKNTHEHTRTSGLHKRDAPGQDYNFSELAQTLDRKMKSKNDSDNYIPITVDRPKAAGIVVQYKDEQNDPYGWENTKNLTRARELAAKYKLPVYIFKDGKTLSDIDGHEVGTNEILDATPRIDDKTYGDILESLCQQNPFASGSNSEKALIRTLDEYLLSTKPESAPMEIETAA